MKKVLIIGSSPVKIDPRVHRQVLGLIETCEIHILGPDPFPDSRVKFHDINVNVPDDRSLFAKLKRLPSYLFNRFEYSYFRNPSYSFSVKKLKQIDFDLIINNEIYTLPLAVKIKGSKTKLHYDAHEYYYSYHGDQEKDERKNNYIKSLIEKYTPAYHTMSTVCEGIANLYSKKLNRNIDVLENLPVSHQLTPHSTGLPIKIVHHGACLRDRMLENMFETMHFLPKEKYEFHIYLTKTQPEYLQELKSKYTSANIFFHEPVPMTELVNEIKQYDIGICIVPFTNENYLFGLPNKFFEYIQARLMIVVNSGEEMPKYVRKHDLGLIVNSMDPEEIASAIAKIDLKEIDRYKLNSDKVAPEYSSDKIYRYYTNLLR